MAQFVINLFLSRYIIFIVLNNLQLKVKALNPICPLSKPMNFVFILWHICHIAFCHCITFCVFSALQYFSGMVSERNGLYTHYRLDVLLNHFLLNNIFFSVNSIIIKCSSRKLNYKTYESHVYNDVCLVCKY